jgi:hypothetical protein
MGLECSLPCSQEPAPDPVLSPINPVHSLSPYFFKIDVYIILPSTFMSSKWSLSVRFYDQNFVCFLFSLMPATCTSQLNLLDLIILMIILITVLARLTLSKMKNKVFCLTFVVQWYSIHWNTTESIR